MEKLLDAYLQASLFGSVIILVVIMLRMILRKAPRHMLCILWMIAILRLLLPIHLESRLSLQPALFEKEQIVAQQPEQEAAAPNPVVVNPNPGISETPTQPVDASDADVGRVWSVLSVIWLSVLGAALAYMVASYIYLKYKLRDAVKCEAGVKESEKIPGAFVLGYFKPRIYLPMAMDGQERQFIIAHERVHIARGDNWWMLLGNVCCCIHWYNPLVWIAYALMCQDIEIACDARVVRNMELEERRAYSFALLRCGRLMSGLKAYPVTFGEGNLKKRIKKVLSYRKAGFWITGIAVILTIAVAVCFLTTPKAKLPGGKEAAEPTNPTEPIPTTESLEGETTELLEAVTQPIISPVTEPATEPVTEPVTEPAQTPTQPPKTQETAKPSGSSNARPSQEDLIPDDLKNADTGPAENTGDHIHAYTVTTVEAICLQSGYDVHTCTCGHEYYDNFVAAPGHKWVYSHTNEVTADHDGGTIYRCENCIELKWENVVPAKHKTYDLGAVDKEATQYASGLGFQTVETGPTTSGERFIFSAYAVSVDRMGGEDYLRKKAEELVDSAYRYCQENGYSASASIVWVEISYSRRECSHYVYVYCAGSKE